MDADRDEKVIHAYRTWIRFSRSQKYMAALTALGGFILGWAAGSPGGRLAVWVLFGVLAAWCFLTGFVNQRRYERLLYRRLQARLNAPSTPPTADSVSISTDERERRYQAYLRRGEVSWGRLGKIIAGVSIAVIVASQFLPLATVVLDAVTGVGAVGVGVSTLCFGMRKALRAKLTRANARRRFTDR